MFHQYDDWTDILGGSKKLTSEVYLKTQTSILQLSLVVVVETFIVLRSGLSGIFIKSGDRGTQRDKYSCQHYYSEHLTKDKISEPEYV